MQGGGAPSSGKLFDTIPELMCSCLEWRAGDDKGQEVEEKLDMQQVQEQKGAFTNRSVDSRGAPPERTMSKKVHLSGWLANHHFSFFS